MTKRATIPFSFSIFFNIAPDKIEVEFEIPKEIASKYRNTIACFMQQ